MEFRLKQALAVLFATGLFACCFANTYTWSGDGTPDADGVYHWNETKNWGGSGVPGEGDIAQLTTSGCAIAIPDDGVTVSRIYATTGEWRLTGGKLTFTDAAPFCTSTSSYDKRAALITFDCPVNFKNTGDKTILNGNIFNNAVELGGTKRAFFMKGDAQGASGLVVFAGGTYDYTGNDNICCGRNDGNAAHGGEMLVTDGATLKVKKLYDFAGSTITVSNGTLSVTGTGEAIELVYNAQLNVLNDGTLDCAARLSLGQKKDSSEIQELNVIGGIMNTTSLRTYSGGAAKILVDEGGEINVSDNFDFDTGAQGTSIVIGKGTMTVGGTMKQGSSQSIDFIVPDDQQLGSVTVGTLTSAVAGGKVTVRITDGTPANGTTYTLVTDRSKTFALDGYAVTYNGKPAAEMGTLEMADGILSFTPTKTADAPVLEWQGGSGLWSDANWLAEGESTPKSWIADASATLGSEAAGGTIRVVENESLGDLRFTAPYALLSDGGILTLASQSVTVDEGVAATADAAVFGSMLPAKKGLGTLILTGTTAAAGALAADGTLVLSNLTAAGVTALTVPDGGVLKVAGANALAAATLSLGARARIVLAEGATAATLTVGTFGSLGTDGVIGDGVTLVLSNGLAKNAFDGRTLLLNGVMKVYGCVHENSQNYTIRGESPQAPGELWLMADGKGLRGNSNKTCAFSNLRIIAAGGAMMERLWGTIAFTDVTLGVAGKDAEFCDPDPTASGASVSVCGTLTFDTTDVIDGETPRTITMGLQKYKFRSAGSGDARILKVGKGTLVWRDDAPEVKSGIDIEEGTFDYGVTAVNSSMNIAAGAELKLNLSSLADSLVCKSGCAVDFAEGAKLTVALAEDLPTGEIVLIDRITPETDVSKIMKTVESEALKGEFSRDGDRLILTLVDDKTYVWTGNGASLKFSDPDNWMGGAIPSAGGTVCLGSADGDVTVENDIEGLSFASLTFVASSKGKVTLTGKPITLSGTVVNGATCPQAVACAVNFLANPVTIETGPGLELAGGFTAAGAVALNGAASGEGLTLGGVSCIHGDLVPAAVQVKGPGSLVCDGDLKAVSNMRFGIAEARFNSLKPQGRYQNPLTFTGGRTVFTNELYFTSDSGRDSHVYVEEGAVVDCLVNFRGSYSYSLTVDGVLNVSAWLGDGGATACDGTGVINAGRCAWGSWLDVNLAGGLTVNTKGTASFGGQGTQHLTLGDATFGCSDGDLTIGMTLDLPSETTGTLRASDTNGVARTITVNKALTGTGALVKTGAGAVVLKAASAGTNAVTIAAGTLEVQETMAVSDLAFAEGGELRLQYGADEAPVTVTGTADLANASISFLGTRQRVRTPVMKVDGDGATIINYENARVLTADGAVDATWKFKVEDGVLFALPKPGLMLIFR